MSIFYECTIYNSGEKRMFNLELARDIAPSDYLPANAPEEQRAHAIITYENSATDPDSYYVRESYEELRAAILAKEAK